MLQIPEGKSLAWIAADPAKKKDVQAIGLEAAMAGITKRSKEKLGSVVGQEGMRGEVVRY
jgi:hypothetical protein